MPLDLRIFGRIAGQLNWFDHQFSSCRYHRQPKVYGNGSSGPGSPNSFSFLTKHELPNAFAIGVLKTCQHYVAITLTFGGIKEILKGYCTWALSPMV